MTSDLTRDEFKTPQGRKRAWRALMLGDHGFLRNAYDNTHEVVPGKLWRTYQPSPAHLKKWKARGVKTIINLRGDKPSGFLFLEEEACAQLGLVHRPFRAFSRNAPAKEFLHGLRALFEEIEYPAVLHCKSGADRAGLAATLFLFYQEGVALDKALDQLTFKYGHVKQGKTGVIDYAFALYLDHARKNDIPLDDVEAFLQWVDTDYGPEATKVAFKSTGWGNFLTEKLLRRE